MPSCAVAMKRSCRARVLERLLHQRAPHAGPAARGVRCAARGAPTIANSAATNSAFSSSSATIDEERNEAIHAHSLPPAAGTAAGVAARHVVRQHAEELAQHVFERDEARAPGPARRPRSRDACAARGTASAADRPTWSAAVVAAGSTRSPSAAGSVPAQAAQRQLLGVQDADDAVARAAIDRHAREARLRQRDRARRASGASTSTASTWSHGTISSRAGLSRSRSARCSRRCSSGSSRPPSRLSAISSSSSSGEWTWRWPVWSHAQQPQHQQAAAVEDADERPVDQQRPLHRHHRGQRHLRRELQRQRLRHQLAEHHVEDRQRHQRRDAGDRVRPLAIALRPRRDSHSARSGVIAAWP